MAGAGGVGDVGEDAALEVHASGEAPGDEVGQVEGGVDADGGEGVAVVEVGGGSEVGVGG